MPSPHKIHKKKLIELVQAGQNAAEIAAFFGCAPRAVELQRKKLCPEWRSKRKPSWTNEQETQLIELFEDGESYEIMAAAVNHTAAACRRRVIKLRQSNKHIGKVRRSTAEVIEEFIVAGKTRKETVAATGLSYDTVRRYYKKAVENGRCVASGNKLGSKRVEIANSMVGRRAGVATLGASLDDDAEPVDLAEYI